MLAFSLQLLHSWHMQSCDNFNTANFCGRPNEGVLMEDTEQGLDLQSPDWKVTWLPLS